MGKKHRQHNSAGKQNKIKEKLLNKHTHSHPNTHIRARTTRRVKQKKDGMKRQAVKNDV